VAGKTIEGSFTFTISQFTFISHFTFTNDCKLETAAAEALA